MSNYWQPYGPQPAFPWHAPQAVPPGTSGLPPSPYHQGGPPPWLAALLAAQQNAAAYRAPIAPPLNNTGAALPPGLVGNTHVPFLQPGGGGYPGNYQGFGGGHSGGQDFGHTMPPTVGRVGV